MRLLAILLIFLLGFQCLPQSVRVQAIAACIQQEDGPQPKKVSVQNPAAMVEDELPHFVLHLHKPHTNGDPSGPFRQAPSRWGNPGCRIPGNQAHDVETPPPNPAA